MEKIRIRQPHVQVSDPHITSDDVDRLSILGNVFDPLMRVRGDGTFSACLAESWTLSDDARTWNFVLRDDVRFNNDEKLTAVDVVFSLRRMRDVELPGELGTTGVIRGYLEGAEIEKSGQYGVRLTTPDPMADLTNLLCEIPILSESAETDAMVGTGAYRIVESGEDRTVLQSPRRRLMFEAEKNESNRLAAVRDGSADIATKLATTQAASTGIRIDRSTTSVCATFMFNLFSKPAQNLHLRRAINLAVDVPALIRDVMHGAADPLTGPLTSRHLGFDPAIQAWPFDPIAARSELSKGGIPEGTEVLIDIPSVLPDEAPDLAERVIDYLSVVGINAHIRLDEDRLGYAMRVRNKEIGDLACFDSSPASTFRVYREKFHSGYAGPWWMGYSEKKFDRLVNRGRATASTEARQALYQQAFQVLRDDAPWLFLYNPVRLTGLGDRLSNWTPSTGGLLLF